METKCSAIARVHERCVIVFPKSRRLELGDNILRTVYYRSIFNHCDIIGLKICRIT